MWQPGDLGFLPSLHSWASALDLAAKRCEADGSHGPSGALHSGARSHARWRLEPYHASRITLEGCWHAGLSVMAVWQLATTDAYM